jgi:hypothetical protein
MSRWTLRIPESIAAQWDALFLDPTGTKVKHNTRNDIVKALLSLTMESFIQGEPIVNISHVHQLIRDKAQQAGLAVEEIDAEDILLPEDFEEKS